MKWEYKVVRYEREPRILFKLDEQVIENRINHIAAEGWELVSLLIQQSFLGREESALATFRRERKL